MIQYLQHHNIDKKKWDDKIMHSQQGLPYALSWYLDVVSPGWDALVFGDYQIIMPITIKRKYGLSYVIQPPFSQQLGIFSENFLERDQVNQFIQNLRSYYGYIHIHLNSHNKLTICQNNLRRYPNFILPIDKPIELLWKNYSENHKRNIRRTIHEKEIIEDNLPREEQIRSFLKEHERTSAINHPCFFELAKKAQENGIGKWQVAENTKGDIITVIFWLRFKCRHIYLFSKSSQEGKEKRASFFLIHNYISKNAGNVDSYIDFEGSKIESIARFFAGFGAKPEYYSVIKLINWWHYLRFWNVSI